MVFFKLEEDDELELPVFYERLLDFCFCCGLIGHRFKECEAYKGQPKDKLPCGIYMRTLSKAEKTKLNQAREKWNRRFEQTTKGYTNSEHHERNQERQMSMDQGENGSEPHQSNSGESERQTIKTGEQLMLMALEPR